MTSSGHAQHPSAAAGVIAPLSLPISLLAVIIAAAALVDLPAGLNIGPISGLAVLTILSVLLSGAVCVATPRMPRSVLHAVMPFGAFLLWAALISIRHIPTKLGAQNLSIITGFTCLLLVSARTVWHAPEVSQKLINSLRQSIAIAAILFVVGYMGSRLGTVTPIAVGTRTFPLFSLVPMAWHLASWKSGRHWSLWVALTILLLILVALARTAFVVGVGLFVLAQVQPKKRLGWLKPAIWGVIAFGLLVLLILTYEPLRSRFFEYDASWSIGGVAINVMGRGTMWSVTWSSFCEAPWFGKGPGSAAETVSLAAPTMTHPHNDYLRLLHDYGIIGFGLWMIAILRLLRLVWRYWRRSVVRRNSAASVHQAAFLALVAALLTMITDNTLAYGFVMFPLAISLGCSLGLASHTRRPEPEGCTCG